MWRKLKSCTSIKLRTCRCPREPPACAYGKARGLPVAWTLWSQARSTWRTPLAGRSPKKSASSSDALVLSGESCKWSAFRPKVRAVWKDYFPETSLGVSYSPMRCPIWASSSSWRNLTSTVAVPATLKLSWSYTRGVQSFVKGRRQSVSTTDFTRS